MPSCITLNTGVTMPAIGFGTWQDKEAQEDAVLTAIEAGYRHIDTAAIYGTEPAVGRALKRCGVPRSELFITTKLWKTDMQPKDVEAAMDKSLSDLQLKYVDLYLMHWPAAVLPGTDVQTDTVDIVETYKVMETLLASGKTRAIGISNFGYAELDRLLANTTVVPAVHQLEMHPWLQQLEFAEYNKSRGIAITQYSPFGNQNSWYGAATEKMGEYLLDDATLKSVGAKYGKSSAQTALAWGVNHGHSVIPKSKSAARIQANLEGDFVLSAEDLQTLDALDRKLRFNDDSDVGYSFFKGMDGKH